MRSITPSRGIFDELHNVKNLALYDICSFFNKWENGVTKLQDKLRAQELLLASGVRDAESALLEIKSKKNNVVQKQKAAFTKTISVLEEAIEKLESEVADLTTEYQLWQEERDKKVSEMKEVWEAHCQAMHRYKKNLNIYIDINDEDSKIFTVYFFKTDKESGSEYSVKLQRKEDLWQMVSMNTHLPIDKKLQEHLAQSNDIQGFLVCVRNQFKRHRDRKP
ncbi:uncharacterized protein LOC126272307 [Schistocerca gregaria]|uniref:uncharacterized protein LOC126272307 n=1 Tax=Schistocerca gregaria TaxID=7010 RepID=UPI00211E3B89|nr:uncharacterized protein LOC126272307 [Schistocerca gregaria]